MSYHHLTMDERHVIYRMQFQGYSNAEIARCVGRHRSTIGRECRRNAACDGRYWPDQAQTHANYRRRAHLRRAKTMRGFKSRDKALAHPYLAAFLRGIAGVCDLRRVI